MTSLIFVGDARARLADIADQSVHTCVTSPPYFGLRDYGHGGQIGLEPTPDEFVTALVEVFREVRRVLRDDGTLWVNLGDSYASAWAMPGGRRNVAGQGSLENGKRENRPNRLVDGLKEKDLIGIPWRVAFALHADGWYLRQDIIWHKPNPMPESVRDRCTKSHEYIFMLSKSPRYYFDADAIKEPAVYTGKPKPGKQAQTANTGLSVHTGELGQSKDGMRNKRSVWSVATRAFKGAHFATFPPDLIEPCVLAGAPVGGIVLDPFGGAGTTGLVAERTGRHSYLIELNPDYAAMAADRIGPEATLV